MENPAVRLLSFSYDQKFDELISLLESCAGQRFFTPLSIFNSEHSHYKNRDFRVTGLIIGQSREEVSETITQLQKEGFTT